MYWVDPIVSTVQVATVVYIHNQEAGVVNLWVLPDGVNRVGAGHLETSVAWDPNGGSNTWHHLPQF